MTRLIIMGPQGSGKGTQGIRVAERLNIPAISTGDIFRENIAGGTELGELAQSYTNRGELVPDEVTNRMVRSRLAQDDASAGFLLDGYPRNGAQALELDAILASQSTSIDAVISLDVPLVELQERLTARAASEGRADDTDEAIRRRLTLYAELTSPLIELYSGRGDLVTIDGTGEIDAITDRVMVALETRGISAV